MATPTNTKATPITPEIAAARVMAAATTLFQITADLADANADAAVYARLKAASTRAETLAEAQTKALAEQDAALSAEATAKAAARFANISGIEILDTTPDEHVLGTSFRITYKSGKYDMYGGKSVQIPTTSTGFNSIPSLVLAYLIEVHPEKVPSKIMALAPGNPNAAFEVYFAGLRRGCLIS